MQCFFSHTFNYTERIFFRGLEDERSNQSRNGSRLRRNFNWSFQSVVSCIIKCYNIGDNHDTGSSDEHVTVTLEELDVINSSILRSIPIVDFNSQDFKDGIECVVCLSELADGDKARVLPSCNHCFHTDCIESWFQSHSTCPVCRKIVGMVQQGARPELGSDEGLVENHDPRFDSHCSIHSYTN